MESSRLIQLDILRAIAIFLVIGAHIPVYLISADTPLTPLLLIWQKCGWTGVDLFFVLSGFLVSGLLFREFKQFGKIMLGQFFIRRGLKIYPSFYVFIILSSFFIFLLGERQPTVWQYFCEIIFIQNYGANIWEHTWSLAIEEHFYLFIGIFIYFRARSKTSDPFRIIILLSVACSIVVLFFRICNVHYFPYTHKIHLFPTHLRFDALLFGVMLSYLHHFKHEKFKLLIQGNRNIIAILSSMFIATSLCWYLSNFYMHTHGLTFLYLGYGGLLTLSIYCFDKEQIKTNKAANVLAEIGNYSYSIYLWHIPVVKWMPAIVSKTTNIHIPLLLVNLFVYVGSSVVIGVIMAKIVEIPLLKLRDKKFPSRSGLPINV